MVMVVRSGGMMVFGSGDSVLGNGGEMVSGGGGLEWFELTENARKWSCRSVKFSKRTENGGRNGQTVTSPAHGTPNAPAPGI